MTYEVLLEIFSMEKLNRLLHRNCSVNFYRITPFHINAESNLSWPARPVFLKLFYSIAPFSLSTRRFRPPSLIKRTQGSNFK